VGGDILALHLDNLHPAQSVGWSKNVDSVVGVSVLVVMKCPSVVCVTVSIAVNAMVKNFTSAWVMTVIKQIAFNALMMVTFAGAMYVKDHSVQTVG